MLDLCVCRGSAGEFATIGNSKLKSESQQWEEILKKRTKEADEAERHLQEIADNPITEKPDVEFTAQELKLLDGKSKPNEMLARWQGSEENTIVAVDNMLSVVKTLEGFMYAAEMLLDQHAHNIYRDTFPDLPEDPREILQAIQKSNVDN